jgi:nucleoside-diphosphate-sugar epimerase
MSALALIETADGRPELSGSLPIRSACVTGASGCIGEALLQQLSGACRTKALYRSESDLSRAWRARGCEVVLGDLSDAASLAELVEGVEVVFHCAATMAKSDPSASYAVNVLGTRALLAAAAQAGCRLFVHVSSISVYAATDAPDLTFTEQMEPSGVDELNPYSRTKLLAEHEVKRLAVEHGLAYIILRPTNVYGPRSKPWFLNIARLVRRLPLLLGDVAIDLVHVDDVAKAAIQAASCPAAYNEAFHLGHERMPLREFMATVARLLHREPRFLPKGLDQLLRQWIDTLYRKLTGSRMSLSLARPRHYPTAKARALFGYSPQVHVVEGLKQTVHAWHAEAQRTRAEVSRPCLVRPRRFEALEQIRVRSEADIVAAVERAARSGLSVRAAGAMGSKNGNFYTPGLALDLAEYDRLVSVRGDRVTVQAGMRLRELYRVLNGHGLALANVGEWSGATVAGALSTGTHGGSIRHGSMASLIDSLKLVLADGSVRAIGREHSLFDYVGVSFGVFGIVSEVTLRCEPRFQLRLEKSVVRFEDFQSHFECLNAEREYWAAVWIPSTRQVAVYAADRSSSAPTRARREERYCLANLARCWLSNRLGGDPIPRENSPAAVVGDWNEILAPIGDSGLACWANDHFRLPLEIEVAVPVGEAERVLGELSALFERARRFPSAPVGLRCGAAEGFKLSPCYRRDSLWITLFVGDESLSRKASQLLARHGCRFHWGKNLSLPAEHVRAQYEAWPEVVRLKRELDPQGLFSNAFTRRFGL